MAWKQEHLSINFCTQHWNLTTLHDSLPVALQQGCFEGTRNWHAFVMPFNLPRHFGVSLTKQTLLEKRRLSPSDWPTRHAASGRSAALGRPKLLRCACASAVASLCHLHSWQHEDLSLPIFGADSGAGPEGITNVETAPDFG